MFTCAYCGDKNYREELDHQSQDNGYFGGGGMTRQEHDQKHNLQAQCKMKYRVPCS